MYQIESDIPVWLSLRDFYLIKKIEPKENE